MPMPKLSHEVAAARVAKLGITFLEPFQGANAKTRGRCDTCGHEWGVDPSCTRRGSGCPKCGRARAGQKHRLSRAIVNYAYREKGLELVGEHEDLSQPNLTRCLRCGNEWTARLADIQGCPHCRRRRRRKATLKRIAQLGFVLLEKPRWRKGGGLDKVKVSCTKCGHEKVLRQHPVGCKECRRLNDVIPIEEIERRLAKGFLRANQLLDKESRRGQRLEVTCLKCHYEFRVMGISQKDINTGCPRCARREQGSISEARVIQIAEQLTGWKFRRIRPAWLKGRSERPMELDGYNETHRVAIEYQGQQHYRPIYGEDQLRYVKKNDNRKRQLCYRRNIFLIRVPYWKRNVEDFLRSKLTAAGFSLVP